jgi:PAS domain S-box-containing protein
VTIQNQPPPSQERDFRVLVENATDGIVVLAHDGKILFANRGAAEMSGYRQDDLPNLSLSRVLAPDELGKALAIRAMRHAGKPAPNRYESTLVRTDGLRVPIEVTVTTMTWLGEPVDVVIFRDISERRRSEAELHHRETVLRSVAAVAADLVRSGSWEDTINDALERLGQAFAVHRVYIWEAQETPGGEVLAVNRRFWVDPAYGAEPDSASLDGYALLASGCGPWLERIRKGEPLIGSSRDFSEVVSATYGTLGVKSVLSLPIMVDGRLWGVLGFSDCAREREWLVFEIDALRVLGSIMGALIRRQILDDALKQSEEQLRATFDQAPTGIFITDQEGWCTEANRTGCEILGYTQDELLRMRISDVVPPEVTHLAFAHFEQVKRGEAPRIELPLVTRTGKVIQAELIGKRLTDGRMQAIVTDITTRRKTEENLRHHDAILEAVSFAAGRFLGSSEWEEWIQDLLMRLGRATLASRVHIYEALTEPDGEIFLVRRNAWIDPASPPYPEPLYGTKYPLRSLGFGYILDRVAREPWQALRSQVPAPVREVFERLGVQGLLLVPIRAEDTWWGLLGLTDCARERVWSTTEIEAIGAAATIVGAMIHRQRVETALVESEVRYRLLVEGSDLSIVLIDREGIFHFGNSPARSRLGLGQEDIAGKSMWDLFPDEEASRQVALLQTAIDRQELLVVEMPTIVRGESRWHETRIQPLTDPEGGCDSALVMVSDITSRKQDEERILSYQERLRSLSSELGLIELRERRRIAGELHDRIGQTLAIAKMRLGKLRTQAGDALGPAIDEVRTLLDQTIQDTRSLTFELSPPVLHELGLVPALEWLVDRFRGQHGILAAFEDDGRAKPLTPDVSVYLFQSVQELLMNVVKHAHAQRVDVLTSRRGDEILVTVADDGIGFDSARSTGIAPLTTGFGLFSIRERLFSLGAKIHVDSAPGKGTRILLTAPLERDSSAGGRSS